MTLPISSYNEAYTKTAWHFGGRWAKQDYYINVLSSILASTSFLYNIIGISSANTLIVRLLALIGERKFSLYLCHSFQRWFLRLWTPMLNTANFSIVATTVNYLVFQYNCLQCQKKSSHMNAKQLLCKMYVWYKNHPVA